MNTELDHLKKMRELLAKGWTQHVMARDWRHNRTEFMDNNAVSFCFWGARERSCWEMGPIRFPSLNRVKREKGLKSFILWNDDPNRTQTEVLALVDRAIEIAETKQ